MELSKVIRKAPAQISQWINGTRTMREESAREIERAARLPDGWLDRLADAPSSDATNAVVFAELLQRLPEAERHLIVTTARYTLHRNEPLFAREDLVKYDAALEAFDPAAQPLN